VIGFAGSVALAGRAVLHEVRFQAGAGELVAVVGPNGAGKSTLLRGLAGLLPGGRPDPVRVAWLPQGARCAWGMSVAEVVALGRVPHGDVGEAAVEAAIAACGLADLRGARIDRLSGGQQRRVMLARVLAGAPSVLLLDEPAADLDPAAAHEVMALLRGRAEAGACVVAVLHDIGLALHHATRMVVVEGGRIVADGVPGAVLPAAAAAFGLPFGPDPRPRLLPP
jgi:iron complex transport system ATP-binding protein